MSDSLYESDFWTWSQQQAAALKARSGDNELDLENLAEEVAALGRSERAASFSYVSRILEHLYKLAYSKARQPRAHWATEIRNFRSDYRRRTTPSIRNMIESELDGLHLEAAEAAQASIDTREVGVAVGQAQRWTLPQILGEEDDPLNADLKA